MKFRQKIVLFLVIVVVDLILCGVTLRMWKGEDGEFKENIMKEIKKRGSQGSRKKETAEKREKLQRENRTWYGRRRPI